jgi:hypothetical protein
MPLADLGQMLARSGFFQDTKDAAQAVVKVLAGRELGFGPVASMTGIYIVKGRVSLSANLLAAAIKRSGRYDYRVLRNDGQVCEVVFYELLGGKREEIGRSAFSLEDARKAGLGGDNWTKFPRNMLFARSISNGAKWFCADVFGGPVYTPDELGALVDGETGEVIDGEIVPPAQPTPPTNGKPRQLTNSERLAASEREQTTVPRPPAEAPPDQAAWAKYDALVSRAEDLHLDVLDLTVSGTEVTLGQLRQSYEAINARINSVPRAE